MRMQLLAFAYRLLTGLSILTMASPLAGAEPPLLELRDDRGEVIEFSVEVCFYQGLETQCFETTGGEPVVLPGRFDSLRVEGVGHGPVSLRRREVPEVTEGRRVLKVPRKVTVHFEHPEDISPTVSLYDGDDRHLRRPAHRFETRSSPTRNLPAGAHLVSMSAPGYAPELRLVDWAPGTEQHLVFRPREGWSVVVRTLSKSSEESIEDATVLLRAATGYELTPPVRYESKSGRHGLAVFSGLQLPLATAEIEHPATLPETLPAITATPGTFGYYEAPLQSGGTLAGAVTLEGEPAAGLELQLLQYERNAPGDKSPPNIIAERTVDAQGRFRIEKLPENQYTVRFFPPAVESANSQRPSVTDVGVEVYDARETPVVVDLAPRTVYGAVYRGTHPAPDHKIVVYPRADRKPHQTEKDAVALAVTNEDGEYEVTLWNEALYGFHITTLENTPAIHKEVVPILGELRVDFHLGPHAVEGRVVDESGEPVEEAVVQLVWQTHNYRIAITSSDGTFSFPMNDEDGEAKVHAQKSGYQASEPVQIRVEPAGPAPAPITLTLESRPGIRGVLRRASGDPMAGGWVTAYRIGSTGGLSRISTTATDGNGGFEIPGSPSGPVRLFYGGPGCPLGSRDVTTASVGQTTDADPLRLDCAALPANVELLFQDTAGEPVPRANVLLRRGRTVIPREVVVQHLVALGVPPVSDGSGRLTLVALEPASYDVYLGGGANAQSVLQNRPDGFLASVSLQAARTASYELTLAMPR